MTIIATPIIRGFPYVLSGAAAQAGWISPLISSVLLFGIMLILNYYVFKKHDGKNLIDVSNELLSKPVGIVIGFVYLAWVIILLGFYIRYFGEHISSNIMSESAFEFIIISMLILVGIVLSKSIVYYARLNEVIFTCFSFAFIITGVISLFTKVKIDNLLPVSQRDIVPILKGSLQGISLFGYYVFIFFMFDDVKIENNNLKLEAKSALAVGLLSTLVMIVTIGAIGYNTVLRINDSYFMIAKNIDVLGFLERLDSILFVMWILADFTTITIFAYIATSIVKTILKEFKKFEKFEKMQSYVSYGILAIAYFVAIYVFNSKFVLEAFAKGSFIICNIILTTALPIILFIATIIRKKLLKRLNK